MTAINNYNKNKEIMEESAERVKEENDNIINFAKFLAANSTLDDSAGKLNSIQIMLEQYIVDQLSSFLTPDNYQYTLSLDYTQARNIEAEILAAYCDAVRDNLRNAEENFRYQKVKTFITLEVDSQIAAALRNLAVEINHFKKTCLFASKATLILDEAKKDLAAKKDKEFIAHMMELGKLLPNTAPNKIIEEAKKLFNEFYASANAQIDISEDAYNELHFILAAYEDKIAEFAKGQEKLFYDDCIQAIEALASDYKFKIIAERHQDIDKDELYQPYQFYKGLYLAYAIFKQPDNIQVAEDKKWFIQKNAKSLIETVFSYVSEQEQNIKILADDAKQQTGLASKQKNVALELRSELENALSKMEGKKLKYGRDTQSARYKVLESYFKHTKDLIEQMDDLKPLSNDFGQKFAEYRDKFLEISETAKENYIKVKKSDAEITDSFISTIIKKLGELQFITINRSQQDKKVLTDELFAETKEGVEEKFSNKGIVEYAEEPVKQQAVQGKVRSKSLVDRFFRPSRRKDTDDNALAEQLKEATEQPEQPRASSHSCH